MWPDLKGVIEGVFGWSKKKSRNLRRVIIKRLWWSLVANSLGGESRKEKRQFTKMGKRNWPKQKMATQLPKKRVAQELRFCISAPHLLGTNKKRGLQRLKGPCPAPKVREKMMSAETRSLHP